MGVSTDGLLWYGWASDEEDDERFEVMKDENNEDDVYEDSFAWLEKHGFSSVEVVEHCSAEHPMYGLAVKGTSITARRGYPKLLGPLETPRPELEAELRKVMGTLGIENHEGDGTIGWHLASMWH